MADTRISQLADGGPLQASDLLVISRAGGNVKVIPPSLDQLAAVHVVGGSVDFNNHKLTGLATPTLSTDAVTKAYADALVSGGGATPNLASVLAAGSDGGGGAITDIADPISDQDAATKSYVDELTFNVISAGTYTLVLTDKGKVVSCLNVTGTVVTVPANASVPFVIGAQILVRQYGGTVSITGASGVTVQSRGSTFNLAGQFSWATLVKTGGDYWDLFGDLA